MNFMDFLGWFSSFLLVLTMVLQLRKQWLSQSVAGVSLWLYCGQFFAEVGFLVYSILVGNSVFIFTNSLLVLLNVVGTGMLINRRGLRGFFDYG